MSVTTTFELGMANVGEIFRRAGIETSVNRDSGDSGIVLEVALPAGPMRLAGQFIPLVYPQLIQEVAASHQQDEAQTIPLLITPNLNRGSFDRCREHGVCVADLSGNAFLAVPGVYVERFVEAKRAARRRSTGTVFGRKGSRLVRAFLAVTARSWSREELQEATGLSAGYVATRVRAFVEAGYCQVSRRSVSVIAPDQLLDDWVAVYNFDRHEAHRFAFEMTSFEEGIEQLARELKRCGVRFAFTGRCGTYLRAPFAYSRVLMAYVDQVPPDFNQEIFRPAPKQGNVVLLLPADEGVFQFTQHHDDLLEVVSDAQLFVDLMKMPDTGVKLANILRDRRLRFHGR